MDIRRLSKINLKKLSGKTCLLAVDLNIEPEQKESSIRILAALPTIRFLLDASVKVIIISHRGRPEPLPESVLTASEKLKEKIDEAVSLRPFAKTLADQLKKPVRFIGHFDFPKLTKEIRAARESIVLLENTRLIAGETENDPALAQKFSTLADFFVDDAFANAHRNHVSTVGVARILPAYAGLLMEREVDKLSQAVFRRQKPFTLILGGAKIQDKAGVIKYWLNRADHILLGGGLANTFLKRKGISIGRSIWDAEADITPFLKSKKIVLPCDWMGEGGKILDIGSTAIAQFTAIIGKSKTVVWNGPLGLIEKKEYAKGSEATARAIAKIKNRAFTLAGGGETTGFIHALGLDDKFDLVSTGGGAMLEFLSGKELSGVKVLEMAGGNLP